jgi:hypothetical protein
VGRSSLGDTASCAAGRPARLHAGAAAANMPSTCSCASCPSLRIKGCLIQARQWPWALPSHIAQLYSQLGQVLALALAAVYQQPSSPG